MWSCMVPGVDRERSVELHTIAFWKLDLTNCVYSYMIAVVFSVMILTYHNHTAGWACARLIQLTSAEYGLHSDKNDCSKCSVCDVKFPKCDFGFSTVVQHSLKNWEGIGTTLWHHLVWQYSLKVYRPDSLGHHYGNNTSITNSFVHYGNTRVCEILIWTYLVE